MPRPRKHADDHEKRVYIWQSRDTTIISFGDGPTAPYRARALARMSLHLTDDDLRLIKERPTFTIRVGDPVIARHANT